MMPSKLWVLAVPVVLILVAASTLPGWGVMLLSLFLCWLITERILS